MSSDETVLGAMPAPPGVVANFDNPESIAHHSIVLATMFALGFSIYVGYQTTNCLGIHIWDCPAPKFYALMKIGDIAGPILFNNATMFTKISLGLFYLRVSPFKTSFRFACMCG
ncbi:hypothetical protein E8E12_010984 [Didymella heteroderae]|uniref:Rhodopsin domain-containing protein n=1 Tax=Didymella heteroderae TaxID=1769908 RepID=A0A9P4X0Z1_9PLEO|nr:hypothetical protein E8E12_010984 [Didymella heteroderae]